MMMPATLLTDALVMVIRVIIIFFVVFIIIIIITPAISPDQLSYVLAFPPFD